MKIITKIAALLAFGAVVVSCDLNLKPSTQIEKDDAFETYADAKRFTNGLNSSYRNTLYGFFSYTSEVQGDMYNAMTGYGNRNGFPHQMSNGFTTGDYNVRDVWRGIYKGITNVNVFLAGVDKVTVTAEQAADIKKWKGFAYFYRAAFYHQLVLKFAVPYNAATATTDLGLPLVNEFDVQAKPSRSTMAETYKFIEDDLALATEFLAGVAGEALSITPTLDAVKALEARVKLYMGKYAAAAALATELTLSPAYALASTQEEMNTVWTNDGGKEAILQMFASLSEYGSALTGSSSADVRLANDIYLGYNSGGNYYSGDFVPTKTCLDMYEKETDLRFSTYFTFVNVNYGGLTADLYMFNKYPGNPALFTPPSRNYAQKPKAFTIAEMYLIAAEANFMAGNVAAAKTALNTLQSARGASQTEATLATIQKEWAKETIGEGFRIDCLKRWGLGFSGRVPQNPTLALSGSGFTGINIPAGYAKLTWPIPADDINTNPNLRGQQNPGW